VGRDRPRPVDRGDQIVDEGHAHPQFAFQPDVLGRRMLLHVGHVRRYEQTVSIRTPWEDARSLMLRWAVKTRSGFVVGGDGVEVSVREGENVWLRLAIGPVVVSEPIRVVAVVDDPLRCGFSYGTLDGHPVSGEEAFVVHRATDDGPVLLTIRSLARPAPRGIWRYAFPLRLVAQRFFRKRYLSSLNQRA
jgi:uncharacterized protein (UPF0548 family)